MLCCAQPCQCVLSQPVANPRSRIIAWHRATFAQRQQRGLDHTNPGLLRSLQFFRSFYETELSLQSRAHFADLKVLCGCQFFLTSWSMSANRAFGTVRSPFCRQSSRIEARNRGNAETETLRRRPQKPHYPKKSECFAHKSVSPVNSHTSKIVTLLCCFQTWAALAHHVFAIWQDYRTALGHSSRVTRKFSN